jgi:Flp pilus assembly protein TadG
MRKSISNTSGQLAIQLAIMALPILAVLGLAVDLSLTENRKRDLQSVLDAAVLSGVNASDSAFRTEAAQAFSANTSNFDIAPTATFAMREETDRYVFTGEASGRVATSFSSVVGISNLDVKVTSEVTVRKETSPPKGCIWVMAPWETNALRINSGLDLRAPGCAIHVYSEVSPAANFNAGSVFDVATLCVKGTSVLNNAGTIPNLALGCTPPTNPISATIPAVSVGSCDHNNLNVNGGSVTLNPGVYCGGINFNGTPDVTLNPGLYILRNGTWNVNGGTFNGTGVSFYFDSTDAIQFNSAVTGALSAPASGTYKDLLFFEKAGLSSSPFILNDGQLLTQGIIHLPSRDMTVNGGGVLAARSLTLVTRTLLFNSVNWTLEGVGPAAPAAVSTADLRSRAWVAG